MPSHHPQSPRTKGERRRRAKATSESNKSLQERRRRSTSTPTQPQTSTTPRRASRGPTKVDNVFRWRFYIFYIERPTTSRSRVAFQRYLQGTRNYLHHRATGAQTKPASVQTGLLDLVRIFCECPSSCSPLLHFQEPTTIPSRPTMVYEDHRRRTASDPSRERSSQARPRDSR